MGNGAVYWGLLRVINNCKLRFTESSTILFSELFLVSLFNLAHLQTIWSKVAVAISNDLQICNNLVWKYKANSNQFVII